MTWDEATGFCDSWLAAWTGNNPDRLMEFYSPDAYYSDPSMPGGLKGHEGIRPYIERLLARNPGWEWMREELFLTDTGFTLKWRARIPVEGRDVVENGLDIVEVSQGKITRNEVYFDRTQLLSALKAQR